MGVPFTARALVAAGHIMSLLLLPGVVPAAVVQQNDFVLELVETVPDVADPGQYPIVSDGHVQLVDGEY